MRRLIRLTKTITDNPLDTIKEVISSAQKVLFEKDKDYVTYQEIVDDELTESAEVYFAAMSLEKSPVEISFKKDGIEKTFVHIFCALNLKGLFASHILVNKVEHLSTLIQKPVGTVFLNVKVLEVDSLEKDTILIVGSKHKDAEPADFKLVVKGVIDA